MAFQYTVTVLGQAIDVSCWEFMVVWNRRGRGREEGEREIERERERESPHLCVSLGRDEVVAGG